MKTRLIVFIVLMSLLGACSAPPQAQTFPTPVADLPVKQPTAIPTQVAPTPAPTAEPTPATPAFPANAVVAADGLNLRLGPGLGYSVSHLLAQGQALQATGRSESGNWIEVHLPDGAGGWVYASYLDPQVSLAALPVTEAYGGPLASPAPSSAGTFSLEMRIVDNVATVTVQRYPANANIVASLVRPADGSALEAASGVTDANGAAALSFSMPRYWADGAALKETQLKLVVSAPESGFSRSASITYIH
jgi:uncharacterized protein YgiM (DUF1202 family)